MKNPTLFAVILAALAVTAVVVTLLLRRFDRRALPLFLLRVPLGTVHSLLETFFATAVIALLERAFSVTTVLLCIAGLSLLLLAVSLLTGYLGERGALLENSFMRHLDLLFADKIMSLDYELLEGPLGRDKYQKAKNACENRGLYTLLMDFFNLVGGILGFLSLSAVIATLNPVIIVVILLTQLLSLLTTLLEEFLVNRTRDAQAKVDRRLNYMTKASRDFLVAKDIRLYAMRGYLQKLSEYFIGEKRFWTNKVYLCYFVSDVLGLLLSAGIKVGVYGYILYRILKSPMSGAEVVLYLSAILGFDGWISAIAQSIASLVESNLSVNNMREFMSLENRPAPEHPQPLPSRTPYTICLENVSFSYPGSDKMILDKVSLTVRAGKRLALVGLNGAGKTTLVKLLCGLYRPTAGRILANGTDIALIDRDSWFTVVSAVFQEARVLPVSVLQNVSMRTTQETDRERVADCLRQAGLYARCLELPDGLDTLLGKSVQENAQTLSGGELQKLLLARAIYKQAPLLLLDEPTAALDAIAENEMYLQYSALSRGRTSFCISHRLSSCRFCDKIAVFHEGQLVQFGSHAGLLPDTAGQYHALWTAQAQYYE